MSKRVQNNYSLQENMTIAIAVLMLGIMAGFFWTYSFNVNYATLEMNGDIYATVQSLFNVKVRNPMFFTFFFGSALISFVAVLCNYRHWRSAPFVLLVAAFLLYAIGIIGFTRSVNLPLNYYTESWVIGQLPEDWEQVRLDWNAANLIRVFAAGGAFLLCLLALLLRSIRGR